jgi:DNA helicase-2/ATP-dependent DNA helicase PcrA
MIEIKDEHIKEAESILISGKEFDKIERIPFIKNFESRDLLAVPGSGKTTALLAKLYCLSKNIPFVDGSGILVLSHTNAAVDEIEKHLKPFCPNLFNYPNFIGTVQTFINKFCVSPYYSNLFGYYGLRIDDGLYNSHIEKALLNEYSSEVGYFKNRNKSIFYKSRFWVTIDNKTIISDGISPIPITLTAPKKWISEGRAEIKTQIVLNFIKNTKKSLIKKGVLHYDDCYFIALMYIFKFPEFTELIRKRFAYVFIDEMQDLEEFQIDIIDKIFHTTESKTVLQRIGDINQSIYNSSKKVKVEADWKPRNPMFLNDSNRLTNEVSKIVNCFTLDPQKDEKGAPRFVVKGLRKIDPIIKPHLIVFDDESATMLESTFSDLITQYTLHTLPEATKYGFKIIGWNAKWDDNEDHKNKLRLENIFPQFKKEAIGNKGAFDLLSKYLQLFDRNKKTLEPARKAILNALIAVLRIEDKTFKTKVRGKDVARYFSKSELINEVKKREDSNDYEHLKSKLFKWSFNLMVNQQFESTYNSVKEFILNEFKEWFDLTCGQETMSFLGQNFEKVIIEIPKAADSHNSNIKIDIGTVHSAKGRTHCATMYVETSYHGYETEKLVVVEKKATKTKLEIFLPNPIYVQVHQFRAGKDIRAKETLKMMYVGFSRPTHLLCFAALKENIGDNHQAYIDGGWEMVDLTSKLK